MPEESGPPGSGATRPAIHVAGNSVVDVLLRGVPRSMAAADEWSGGNVCFLNHPPDCVLGGNGGSVAYVLGRLGSRVSLNTRVGDDAFGTMVRAWLGSAGVVLVGAPATHTAVNVIALEHDGTRRSHYYTGERVAWRRSLEAAGAAWFYASGYGQVVSGDLRDLTEVFRAVRARGTKVAFDPGPWFFAAARQEDMRAAWREVDCLIGTERELSTWRLFDSVKGLISGLLACGPGRVVVKRGGEGVAFGGREDGMGALGTDRIERANTVGAGDTFNAGLLHGLCGGKSLEDSVRIGMGLATDAVRMGRGALGVTGTNDLP